MADRLVSPAERVERATEPWSTYVVLPVFAFTAAGVSFTVDLGRQDAMVFFGVALALAIGKPIGIILTAWGRQKKKSPVSQPQAQRLPPRSARSFWLSALLPSPSTLNESLLRLTSKSPSGPRRHACQIDRSAVGRGRVVLMVKTADTALANARADAIPSTRLIASTNDSAMTA